MTTKADQVSGHSYQQVSVDDLYFDPRNPRLIEYVDGDHSNQDELLKILYQHMAVDELAMSIASSGYFAHEPLFVVEESKKLYVIEGNRRLAAVKLLVSAARRKLLNATDLPKATPGRIKELATLPVVRTTRREAWQYLGFKHVNGPARWDSYSKAQYIADVHNQYKISLDRIATQIGDKHKTVQRLYRALMVLAQAERTGVFDKLNIYKGRLFFSHLYTGLDYEGIADFVRVKNEDSETKSPIPTNRLKELGELCTWLYGDKTSGIEPLVQSQNPHLRQLDEVLRSKGATKALRSGLPLGVALDVSYGDASIFERSLFQARDALQKARATLSTGYRGEEDLMQIGEDVSLVAHDLAEEMRRLNAGRKKKAGGKSH